MQWTYERIALSCNIVPQTDVALYATDHYLTSCPEYQSHHDKHILFKIRWNMVL